MTTEDGKMICVQELDERSRVYPLVEVQGVRIRIPHPEEFPPLDLVEREDVLEPALAAWTVLDGLPPLNFRLYGPPGVGKNAIVYQLARLLHTDLYILNGHEELEPEDIACSARFSSTENIEYVASPLFAAMLRGGIFFFDEIGKAPPAALNPLASVLDERRTLTSVLAGIHLKAHPDFRFCAALNEDEEAGGRLPQFMEERLNPAIYVGIPPVATLRKILRNAFSTVDERWIEAYLKEFWEDTVSPRDALKHLQFAHQLAAWDEETQRPPKQIGEYLETASGGKVRSAASKDGGQSPKPTRKKVTPRENSDETNSFLALLSGRKSKTVH